VNWYYSEDRGGGKRRKKKFIINVLPFFPREEKRKEGEKNWLLVPNLHVGGRKGRGLFVSSDWSVGGEGREEREPPCPSRQDGAHPLFY